MDQTAEGASASARGLFEDTRTAVQCEAGLSTSPKLDQRSQEASE